MIHTHVYTEQDEVYVVQVNSVHFAGWSGGKWDFETPCLCITTTIRSGMVGYGKVNSAFYTRK